VIASRRAKGPGDGNLPVVGKKNCTAVQFLS
jgi:hypothetical protein